MSSKTKESSSRCAFLLPLTATFWVFVTHFFWVLFTSLSFPGLKMPLPSQRNITHCKSHKHRASKSAFFFLTTAKLSPAQLESNFGEILVKQ